MASFCRFLLWILWQSVQVGGFASCCSLLTYSCGFWTLPFSSLNSVLSAVVALAVVLGTAVGCAPKQAGEGEGSAKVPKEDPMATQQVDWTMDIDCKTCHTTETETLADVQCPQASEHGDLACNQCHTLETPLKEDRKSTRLNSSH